MLEKGDKNTRSLSVEERTAKAFLEVEFRWLPHAIRQQRQPKTQRLARESKQKNAVGLKIAYLVK